MKKILNTMGVLFALVLLLSACDTDKDWVVADVVSKSGQVVEIIYKNQTDQNLTYPDEFKLYMDTDNDFVPFVIGLQFDSILNILEANGEMGERIDFGSLGYRLPKGSYMIEKVFTDTKTGETQTLQIVFYLM